MDFCYSLCAKINEWFKNFSFYIINDKFHGIWELLILEVVAQNVDIVMKWLNYWKCMKCEIIDYSLKYLNEYMAIMRNDIEKRNGYCDYYGNIVWNNWKWKGCFIALIIIALPFQYFCLLQILNWDLKLLHWEGNVVKRDLIEMFGVNMFVSSNRGVDEID